MQKYLVKMDKKSAEAMLEHNKSFGHTDTVAQMIDEILGEHLEFLWESGILKQVPDLLVEEVTQTSLSSFR